MDAKIKDGIGSIWPGSSGIGSGIPLNGDMQRYAGHEAKIVEAGECSYNLDIDGGNWYWQDWMFDPGFKADGLLSAEDAIMALLKGEKLYTQTGVVYSYSLEHKWFFKNRHRLDLINDTREFSDLYRHPVKRKRLMTRWEVLDWAGSEASRGWVVRRDDKCKWVPPQCLDYNGDLAEYQRARLLPDRSGVDESTIQGFEVEE
jgi:hypothetical protein